MNVSEESAIPVLYEDEHLLIIDKPHGLFVHRNSFEPDAPNCVDMLESLRGERPYTVHRLDRGTSGILVFARTVEAASCLGEQFRDGGVRKRYSALVRGHVAETVEIDRPVKEVTTGVRYPARSIVHPVARTVFPERSDRYPESWYTLVDIDLLTGRRHQARSHCAWISHPIIGDAAHGDKVQNRFFRERFGFPHMFLRSVSISFDHPSNASRLEITTGIPVEWRTVLNRLGF